jgi:hypothetical protein
MTLLGLVIFIAVIYVLFKVSFSLFIIGLIGLLTLVFPIIWVTPWIQVLAIALLVIILTRNTGRMTRRITKHTMKFDL